MSNPYPYSAIKLNTGTYMPLLGLGTFMSSPGEVGRAVKEALAVGYRHIDCAGMYKNEDEVGQALQEVFNEGKIKREDVFITSKIPMYCMDPAKVESRLDQTLAELRTTYLDLYLIHAPISVVYVDGKPTNAKHLGFGLQDIWRVFESLFEKKKVRAIGVSNYTVASLTDLLCYSKIAPAINQVERHPFLVQKDLVNFCRSNQIHLTAYASLGALGYDERKAPEHNLLTTELVGSLAKKYGKTPAQILIRWSLDTEVVAIPKSVKPERIRENFSVWDFKLTAEEVQQLSALDKNVRFFGQDWHGVPLFN